MAAPVSTVTTEVARIIEQISETMLVSFRKDEESFS